jgi:methyltransferase (TIGR00027 family)
MPADGAGRLGAGQPSATALSVALRRAVHQLIDHPRVFEDPLATRIIGEAALERLKIEPERPNDYFDRGLRLHVVTRSRYAEDCLHKAYTRGVRQYMVLGAGLDTFGWRNPYPDLEVFEVDHPATQAWKREQVDAAGLDTPASSGSHRSISRPRPWSRDWSAQDSTPVGRSSPPAWGWSCT